MRRTAAIAVAALALASGCGGGGPSTQTAATPGTHAATPAVRAAIAAQPALSPPLARRPAGRTLRVGPLPDAIAADPFTHTLAVAIHDPSRLALVDSRSGRVKERVEVPVGQEARPAPAVFLVPAETGRRAVAVQPATRTPAVGTPLAAAIVLGRTFVTGGGAVDVLDRGRPTAKLGAATTQPAGIVAGDFDTKLAVVSTARRTLELYDPRALRLIAARPAGRGPTNVVAFGDLLFVADTRGSAVLTYSTRPRLHAVARIPLPGAPYGLAVDPIRRNLHVTLTDRNVLTTISIDTNKPTATVPTVRQPDAVAVDSATGTIAIAGRSGGLLQLVPGERPDAVLPRPGRTSG